ncbi:MAG: zinc-ribbon domain-containing protein [Lachnospiraceae bacterium]|nr:zinc-ribbon domain-containing protein [Lachnospiraceae bacterium]
MPRINVTSENCLATLYPEIAAQWHPTKNGDLTPEKVRVNTVTRSWWKCEKGHEWKAKISARVSGLGCPVCLQTGKRIPGLNDLQSQCPGIAAQWHPTKNGDLHPSDICPYSNKKVWWRCSKGHEWRAMVQGRVEQNSRCPYCIGRLPIAGETDLATLFPNLAAEWDYELNDRDPCTYNPRCPEKVAWICEKGHRWIAKIENRTERGQGCPYCSGREAIPGETDIATLAPDVMVYWDYEKNSSDGIRPENIKPHSDKRIWCICEKGHSWKPQAKHLVRGDRCPYCRNQKISPGENDFATLAPKDLLAEWHPEKNKDLKPDGIALHYGRKVWWRCSNGHEWRATPDGRMRATPFTGCPYCTGMYVAQGETDLLTRAPELMDEFSERNRMTADAIHWKTSKKVWWKCRNCGYEWMANVNRRTQLGSGCPRCSGKVK